ncbi:MAG TPA: ATP-binding cassette domain-containing protein [Planctomycetota bacterium]|nr:ATP-binding cassette domain-containing protein [Planctomycetota bacterium]
MSGDELVLSGRDLRKEFRRDTGEVVHALEGVSLEARHGSLTALVGPDGAGKTTLIRLACGLSAPDSGELIVLGVNVTADPQQIQDRIGYMPQKFGLYEDLTVQENLNLYADLHGIGAEERQKRYPELMTMTALGPFTKRLAGKLSGGMKQKLGLACTLISSPEFLLLDEPTVGVDPLSRRELWDIIFRLVHEQGLTVLLSTAYLDEAERCGHAIVMHQGKVLAQGEPAELSRRAEGRTFFVEVPAGAGPARSLQTRLLEDSNVVDAVPEAGRVRLVRREPLTAEALQTGLLSNAKVSARPPRLEDGFMLLLRQNSPQQSVTHSMKLEQPLEKHGGETVVQVQDLVRRFGDFTAVDHVSFEVHAGEVFGLLGPNGAGKTTTFRMLCGLLPATSGSLRVAGVNVRDARASARQRIGYVAQKFSLYGQLSVQENLDFFASAYGLRGERKRKRIDWAVQQFELKSLAKLPSGQLPGGFKQRLAMAAALLHEPQILFLDEPTSGADPLARREFWARITALAEQGVTVIVTTHFMEEAEYCDRLVIQDSGQVLVQGTPNEVRRHAHPSHGGEPTMEDAFIAVVEEARRKHPEENREAKGAAA